VDSIPHRIEPGDLVGKEFKQGGKARRAHNPRAGQHFQRQEVIGQRQRAVMHRQAGRQHAQIKPPARKQADTGGNPQNLDDPELTVHRAPPWDCAR
jgi:hypothetical protein